MYFLSATLTYSIIYLFLTKIQIYFNLYRQINVYIKHVFYYRNLCGLARLLRRFLLSQKKKKHEMTKPLYDFVDEFFYLLYKL